MRGFRRFVLGICLLTAGVTAAFAQTEVTPGAGAVTASTQDTNVPANVVDNNLGTRWSGDGDGAWLRLDLGTARTVSHVRVAVHQGNARRNRFDLQTSADGTSWATAWTGESSGTTTAEETYDFTDVVARYVRYVGHGSNVSTWNSVSEVSVFAAAATPTPTAPPASEITPGGSAVTASTHDGNVPANAVDNNLATRWSASGDGVWLKLDLGSARTIGYVTLAWYNGNTRSSLFDLQVSNDNATWTTVLSGGRSGGTSNAEETFDFPDATARYIRYLGHGNTDPTKSQWNSVTELSVFATP